MSNISYTASIILFLALALTTQNAILEQRASAQKWNGMLQGITPCSEKRFTHYH
jgi:hypothetical protein